MYGMTNTDFETRARTLLRQQPFQPFAILLADGERIDVQDSMGLAFNGGAAAGWRADGDVVFFNYDQVRSFATLQPENQP